MVGSAIVELGDDEVPIELLAPPMLLLLPMLLPLVLLDVVSGIGVVTDGAVLAGVVVVSTFLPHAPSASRAERATTDVTVRVLKESVGMKIS